jgi:N-acetylneuraminic acid mutarotase
MNQCLGRATALALTWLVLASCADSPTEPAAINSASPEALVVAATANVWSKRANLPSDRKNPAVAVVTNAQGQTVLYAIGGATSHYSPLGTVQAYNAATNTWSNRASLPVALSETNGAGVINGKIYLSGGKKSRFELVPYLFMYDPALNRWTRKRDLPNAGNGGVTGVHLNKLYVATWCEGFANEPGCPLGIGMGIYRYDPATDRWTFLTGLKTDHFAGMGGFIGGKFYLTGGPSSSARVLDVYDPATNTWDTRAPMPAGRFQAAYAAIGGKLYVTGGVEQDLQNNDWWSKSQSLLRYDPASNTWTSLAPLPQPSWDFAGARVVVNGKARFEVVGGVRPGNNLQYLP